MSSYDAGIWSGAVRIATFATFVGYSVGSVLNVRVAKYHRVNDLDLYLKKAWKLSLAVLVLMIMAMPLAHLAIKLTIGASYLEATQPLQILLLSAGLGASASPYIALFYLFDKPQFYTWFGVLQISTLLLGGIMAIPAFGLTGAAWVRVVMRALVLLFTVVYAYKSYREYVGKKSQQL
jgi:O-antigen/teichoic acid export membrane protein